MQKLYPNYGNYYDFIVCKKCEQFLDKQKTQGIYMYWYRSKSATPPLPNYALTLHCNIKWIWLELFSLHSFKKDIYSITKISFTMYLKLLIFPLKQNRARTKNSYQDFRQRVYKGLVPNFSVFIGHIMKSPKH